MIEANELRINNYWQHKETKSIHQIIYAIQIVDASILGEPIPLTEEWKKRLGVKINKYYDESGLLMMNIKTDFFEVNCQMEEIKYVHQLQNLYFALTGTELTLNQ